MRWEKLESDQSFEFEVLSFVDHPHASFPKLFENACPSPKVYCPGIRALGIEELPKRVKC